MIFKKYYFDVMLHRIEKDYTFSDSKCTMLYFGMFYINFKDTVHDYIGRITILFL